MRELAISSAAARKKLMQSIFRYLGRLNVKARLVQDPSPDADEIAVFESAIQLQEEILDTIRLVRVATGGGYSAGEVFRFQFTLPLNRELPVERAREFHAQTNMIKTGKFLGLFGGKITGFTWRGGALAAVLNSDAQLVEEISRCTQALGEMDFDIEVKSGREVSISGPYFVNPDTITALYSHAKDLAEQDCVFTYKIADRIAAVVRQLVGNPELQTRDAERVAV